MEVKYQKNKDIDVKQILHLYNDAKWTAYTNNPKKLKRAFSNSLLVISAWNKNELVGLIRIIGDGETIIYIQDILVLESFQRKGIGKKLIKIVLDKYPNVRQKVLLTDDTEKTRGFYETLGFSSCDKGSLVAFFRGD